MLRTTTSLIASKLHLSSLLLAIVILSFEKVSDRVVTIAFWYFNLVQQIYVSYQQGRRNSKINFVIFGMTAWLCVVTSDIIKHPNRSMNLAFFVQLNR